MPSETHPILRAVKEVRKIVLAPRGEDTLGKGSFCGAEKRCPMLNLEGEPARHAKPRKKVNEGETRSQRTQERRLFYSNIRLQGCIKC